MVLNFKFTTYIVLLHAVVWCGDMRLERVLVLDRGIQVAKRPNGRSEGQSRWNARPHATTLIIIIIIFIIVLLLLLVKFGVRVCSQSWVGGLGTGCDGE